MCNISIWGGPRGGAAEEADVDAMLASKTTTPPVFIYVWMFEHLAIKKKLRTTLTSPVTGVLFGVLQWHVSSFRGAWLHGKGQSRLHHVERIHRSEIKTKGRVDPTQYPLAMLNEPPPGTTAQHAIPQLPPRTKIAAKSCLCTTARGTIADITRIRVSFSLTRSASRAPRTNPLLGRWLRGGCRRRRCRSTPTPRATRRPREAKGTSTPLPLRGASRL